MPVPAFGTAQLYELADRCRPRELLDEAWRCGFRRFDTAPMYGGGRAELDVAALLAREPGIEVVTTKVGLAPPPRRRARRLAVAAARRVLGPDMLERARAKRTVAARRREPELVSGRFATAAVTASVEESLRRLGGRIDRLLLHEVRPHDVTAELVDLLDGLLRRGDVGAVGVATQNHDTLPALAAAGTLLTVAHVAVGPLHEPVALPDHVDVRVGHGLLGGGSDHLRRLQAVLDTDAALAERWRTAAAGTEFETDGGLARALLSRGPHLGVTEVLVATRRRERIEPLHALAGTMQPLPVAVLDAIEAMTRLALAGPTA